ncbi:MAG TPA: hypothetical protein ENJ31_07005 [Anaerolineae bacterium]|nr:hypothetical protein [Anaerolineae bacterium]
MYRRIFFLLTIAMLTLLIALTVAQAQAGPPAPPRPPQLPPDAEQGPQPPRPWPEEGGRDRLPPPPPDRRTTRPVKIEPLATSGVVRYVSTTGTDSGGCTSSSNPCRTVQYAVDVSGDGDEIRVAEGTYTDIHSRLGITQTVYLSRSLILRGGYKADFSEWDPAQYTTTLDAGGQGRVLYISGAINPTVEGLHFAHGDADGLGGSSRGYDAGGGVYIITATAALSGCRIYSSTARYGGGLYLSRSPATLTGNTVSGNSAGWGGGGLYLYDSPATLTGNTVNGNSVNRDGGGLSLYASDAMLTGNTVNGNSAYRGGGLYLSWSDATLTGNTVSDNSANYYSLAPMLRVGARDTTPYGERSE